MYNVQRFVDNCDMVLNIKVTIEDAFKAYCEPYLLTEDYDAMVTMYGILLNKEIEERLYEYKKAQGFDTLPEHLDKKDGIELCSMIEKWQANTEAEMNDLQNQFLTMVKKYYDDKQKNIPEGMFECISHIGNALIHSSMMNDESFERDWYVISVMFALAYKGHIKVQQIKDEYINEYKAANSFIEKHKICLPYYYIAVWDLWKTQNNYNEKRFEHNRERLKRVVSEIPEFYRGLLSGISFYPTKDRERTVMTGKDENGETVPVLAEIVDVPFYNYLPTFVKNKSKKPQYRDGLKREFFHPMSMMDVPCTSITSCLDVELYLNNLYKEIQIEKMRKKIEEYEPNNYTYEKREDGVEVKPRKKISKRLDNLIELSEREKNELIMRLENNSPKTADLMLKFEGEKDKKEILKRLDNFGYAKKTYDERKNQSNSQLQKSIPTKDTLIGFAFIMGLSLKQTKDLLFSSGYIFSPAIYRDVVIEYLLEKGQRNIVYINEFLHELDLKIIEGRKGNNSTSFAESE